MTGPPFGAALFARKQGIGMDYIVKRRQFDGRWFQPGEVRSAHPDGVAALVRSGALVPVTDAAGDDEKAAPEVQNKALEGAPANKAQRPARAAKVRG